MGLDAGPGRGISRRRVLRAGCALAVGGAAACLGSAVYSTQLEPAWIEITEVEVPLAGLPERFDGLTVAQLSDLHMGPHVSAGEVRRGVETANTLGADLVVLTGDFVYRSVRYAAGCARELAALRATLGVLAVLGNHDIWNGADRVAADLTDAGIRVLRDEALPLGPESGGLWLMGVEDTGYTAGYLGGSFDEFQQAWQPAADALGRLMAGIPDEAPRLLLVHNPDFIEMLPPGRIDLALCGHTHGGQVRLPALGPPVVPSCFGQKYAGGLVVGPGTSVYVNRGLGVTPPPVRVNCRPEITRLRLVRG